MIYIFVAKGPKERETGLYTTYKHHEEEAYGTLKFLSFSSDVGTVGVRLEHVVRTCWMICLSPFRLDRLVIQNVNCQNCQ